MGGPRGVYYRPGGKNARLAALLVTPFSRRANSVHHRRLQRLASDDEKERYPLGVGLLRPPRPAIVWVLSQRYNSVLKDLREALFHCKDRDSLEECLRENDVIASREERVDIRRQLASKKHAKLVLKTTQPAVYHLLDWCGYFCSTRASPWPRLWFSYGPSANILELGVKFGNLFLYCIRRHQECRWTICSKGCSPKKPPPAARPLNQHRRHSQTTATAAQRERLATIAAGVQARQYLGKAWTVEEIDALGDDEAGKLYACYEARLGAAMTKTLGRAALHLNTAAASLLLPIPPENQKPLMEELESDPFVGHALTSTACELYYRYGKLLAPITAALTTVKYCQFGHQCARRIEEDGGGQQCDGDTHAGGDIPAGAGGCCGAHGCLL